MPAHSHNPPNISKDKKGYNSKLFSNHRAVRRVMRKLGYKVSLTNTKAPDMVVRQFQRHYNHCSIKRFPKWGSLKVDGVAGRHTLNALEIALTWAKKKAKRDGGTVSSSWQGMCRRLRPPRRRRRPGQFPRPKHVAYVEVMGKGQGKLRRPGKDLRVYIKSLAKKGDLLFARVRIPPQFGMPNGMPGEKWYPAVVKPGTHHPVPAPPPHVPQPAPGGYPTPAPGYPTPGGGGLPKPPWMP